jgi:hypothetical protein
MRGACIGRRAGRLVAKAQVSKVARNSTGSIDCSICVPPAGFEPALTAPERVAVYCPDQRKRVAAHHDREPIGGSRQVEAAGQERHVI